MEAMRNSEVKTKIKQFCMEIDHEQSHKLLLQNKMCHYEVNLTEVSFPFVLTEFSKITHHIRNMWDIKCVA